jgi:hypothetical protein
MIMMDKHKDFGMANRRLFNFSKISIKLFIQNVYVIRYSSPKILCIWEKTFSCILFNRHNSIALLTDSGINDKQHI